MGVLLVVVFVIGLISSLPEPERCKSCDGSGVTHIDGLHTDSCKECDGDGFIV